MLLIISLSTLIFATVTTKIEENRFVFWGTVLPNENISVVLDITIPRHSNAFIRCGAECSTQNNCSGMDVCEEMGQCRIWKTSFAENLNSNDTAVRNCRRYLKVHLLELEQNQQSTMKTNDIVNNQTFAFPIHEQNSLMNITTHTIEPETIYASFDLTTTDEATFSRSPSDSTTESSNLLKTTTTYEASTETSDQGATTTTDQSTHNISSQTGSTLDPYTSESLRPGTTTTNTQVIETLSNASTANTDSKRNEMSTQSGSTTLDLHTTTGKQTSEASTITHSATSDKKAATEPTSYSSASTDISVTESSFAIHSTVANPSSEQTTTGIVFYR
nr:papilin-like [Crassostrea gigas]